MMRALFSGVSGLRGHQLWLDVIGNNIANVNTSGFKASGLTFQDLLSQTIQGEVRPTANQGGISFKQVGLGMAVGSIRNFFTQGLLQATNNPTDLAIQGDGLFILSDGADRLYTRAGAFALDGDGNLVDSVTGLFVQGATGNIAIPPGSSTGAATTTTATFGGNLDASAADASTYQASFSIRDSLGEARNIVMTFTRDVAAGGWDWTLSSSDPDISSFVGGTGTIVFDVNGNISAGATAAISVDYAAGVGVTDPQPITLDFGSATNPAPVTGFAAPSTARLTDQDGATGGNLVSFSIGSDGSVTALYDNGETALIDTIQTATFNNPGGLLKVGANLFRETNNSGIPNEGVPGTGGRGTLLAGALEASNVELAQEFTNMIIAQRGFQANARVISTSDEVLQDLVNLKR